MSRIGPTAHYTAHVWRRLGLPHAELFDTGMGWLLFWSFRLSGEWVAAAHPTLPSMVQYLEMRHRAIELALEQHAPDRIVEIGAGLSRRGLTWAADRGVEYVEVDLPRMVEVKRALIAERAPADLRARAAGRLEHVALDVFGAGFADWLASRLASAARPAVVAEGLLAYFGEADRLRVASAIHAALAGRPGMFVCDLRAREGGRVVAAAATVLRGAIWIATRGRGAREDFGSTAAIRAFFQQSGFTSAEPVPLAEAAPHLATLRTPVRVWRAGP